MEQLTTPELDVTVVLPAYNEAGHIGAEVDRITATMKETAYSFGDPGRGRRLDRRHGSAGRGAARSCGSSASRPTAGRGRPVASARARARGRYVVWTDADMTYPNELIPELLAVLDRGDAEQVVGWRTSEEGTYKALRVPAKWAIRRIAEWLSHTKIPDLNSGLRAFTAESARPHLRLLPPGFSCVTTITLAFLANGLRVHYMPVPYAKRSGKSHFHPIKDAYRYLLQILRMVTLFEPLRVFAPPSLVLLAVAVGKTIYDLIEDPFRLSINTLLLFMTGLILFAVGLLADLVVRVNRE